MEIKVLSLIVAILLCECRACWGRSVSVVFHHEESFSVQNWDESEKIEERRQLTERDVQKFASDDFPRSWFYIHTDEPFDKTFSRNVIFKRNHRTDDNSFQSDDIRRKRSADWSANDMDDSDWEVDWPTSKPEILDDEASEGGREELPEEIIKNNEQIEEKLTWEKAVKYGGTPGLVLMGFVALVIYYQCFIKRGFGIGCCLVICPCCACILPPPRLQANKKEQGIVQSVVHTYAPGVNIDETGKISAREMTDEEREALIGAYETFTG